jgi:AraC-like DNA-binding protein
MSGTPGIDSWLRFGRHRCSPIPQKADGGISVLIAIGGQLEGKVGDRRLRLCGPRSALFLPDRCWSQASLGEFDGLWLRLEADRLARAAAQVSGHTWSSRRFAPLLQETVCLDGAEGPAQRHLQRLEVVAQLLDPSAGHPPEETEPLALRDVLDRLVVLALWGDRLLGSSRQSGAPGSEREAILEDLLAWIRANSHRPLHLAELEQRSGYSDRSLRNAFQARFGCPPKQWIRQTRMESARQRLLDPRPGDSVSSIARDHGYQHVSQFSRDFRCVFGQPPSLLMRQARRAAS